MIASHFEFFSPKQKDLHLNGEVFIVTNGRENYKLGLVPIRIVEVGENEPVYVGEVIAEAKSNSDGKFTVLLPPGKYKIFASAKRDVIGKLEKYSWAVPVNLKDDNQTIILGNDNLSPEERP
jgi:hypothetical protein